MVRRVSGRDYFHSIVKATSINHAAEMFTDENYIDSTLEAQLYCMYPLVSYSFDSNGKIVVPEGTYYKMIMPMDIQ